RRLAVDDRDVVAPELIVDHLLLAARHLVDPRQQLGGARPLGTAAALEAREPEHRFPERLAGDRPRLHADAPQAVPSRPHRHPPPQLGAGPRGPRAGRPAPDAHEVEVAHGVPPTVYRKSAWSARSAARRRRSPSWRRNVAGAAFSVSRMAADSSKYTAA